MDIADKVQYILVTMYWSQQQLADKVGVNQTTISTWKRGKYAHVREKYIQKIEELYNQARRLDWDRKQTKSKPELKPSHKVLSKRGKMVLEFPWYSYQK